MLMLFALVVSVFGQDPPHASPPAETCSAFALVDPQRLSNRLRHGDDVPFEEVLRSALKPPELRDFQRADRWVIVSEAWFINDRAKREVAAFRIRGEWRAAYRTLSAAALSKRAFRSRWRVTTLSSETGHLLETLVADPCLWTAPRFLDAAIPITPAGWVTSFDGPITSYEVHVGNRTWSGLQISWRLGPPAELRSALFQAIFHDDATSKDYIDPSQAHAEPKT